MAQKRIDPFDIDGALMNAQANFTDLYTNGVVPGGGTLAIANGGTAAATASAARTSLGAAASGANADITGLSALTSIHLDTGTKTATASGGAATLNKSAGVVTSEALTTAAGATYTLTLTNSTIAAADQVFASVNLGAGTGGTPTVAAVKPAAGSCTIQIQNIHASTAFNAAIVIQFAVFKN